MKRYFLIFITIALFLGGCTKEKGAIPVPLKGDPYSPAVKNLSTNTNITADLSVETTISAGNNTYKKQQTGILSYQNYGCENETYCLQGNIAYGDYNIPLREIQATDKHYLVLKEQSFCSELKADAMQIPLQLLDPALYKTATLTQDKKTQYLQYSDPTGPESWALPVNAEFTDAAAAATLDSRGQILQAQYTVVYHYGDIRYEEKYVLTYQSTAVANIHVPEQTSCIPVEDIYAALYLEQAYGYLQQVTNVNGVLTEKINSDASSIHYSQEITLNTSAERTNIETTVKLWDNARGSESGYTQSEVFKDGQYAISRDGGQYNEQSGMDANAIHGYCQKLLTKNIPSCTYIENCAISQTDNMMTLTIQAGEALAETICQNSCQTIYQDANFLDSKSSDYEDYTVSYVITIDSYSGLPLYSALDFTGHHTIENIRYQLSTQYIQEYTY